MQLFAEEPLAAADPAADGCGCGRRPRCRRSAASAIWPSCSIWPGRCPLRSGPASSTQPVVTNTVAVKPYRSSSGIAWLWKSAYPSSNVNTTDRSGSWPRAGEDRRQLGHGHRLIPLVGAGRPAGRPRPPGRQPGGCRFPFGGDLVVHEDRHRHRTEPASLTSPAPTRRGVCRDCRRVAVRLRPVARPTASRPRWHPRPVDDGSRPAQP